VCKRLVDRIVEEECKVHVRQGGTADLPSSVQAGEDVRQRVVPTMRFRIPHADSLQKALGAVE